MRSGSEVTRYNGNGESVKCFSLKILFFIHYGKKEKLSHRPIDQFDGNRLRMKKNIFITARQKKFHQKVSNMLLSLRSSDEWHKKSSDVEGFPEEWAHESSMVLDEGTVAVDETSLESPSQFWEEDYPNIDVKRHPNLFLLIGEGKKTPLRVLTAIFAELLSILGNNNNYVDFHYLNGRKGHVLIVPQVKSLHAFMEQARKLRWIDYMLEHLAGPGFEKDDAAEWLSYFLGKRYDASYTFASEALGLPLIERLDYASAQAMWSDANINVTQQRIIKKHLRFHFGKRVFVPEKEISQDFESYFMPTV
jgi:hypothetical protein